MCRRRSRRLISGWARGPLLGVYFSGSGPGALPCSHPNIPTVDRTHRPAPGRHHAAHLVHHRREAGPRHLDTDRTGAARSAVSPTEVSMCSLPAANGRRGIRAVRDSPNILVETSGFDSTAGFVDMAVRELGSERIVFGSHLPSRSLGTELAKSDRGGDHRGGQAADSRPELPRPVATDFASQGKRRCRPVRIRDGTARDVRRTPGRSSAPF